MIFFKFIKVQNKNYFFILFFYVVVHISNFKIYTKNKVIIIFPMKIRQWILNCLKISKWVNIHYTLYCLLSDIETRKKKHFSFILFLLIDEKCILKYILVAECSFEINVVCYWFTIERHCFILILLEYFVNTFNNTYYYYHQLKKQ